MFFFLLFGLNRKRDNFKGKSKWCVHKAVFTY